MQNKKTLNPHVLLCEDLEAARRSREHIAHPPQEEIDFYKRVKQLITSTPIDRPLPREVPVGELPEARRNRGGFTGNLTPEE